MLYYETSAKDGTMVRESFEESARKIIKDIKNNKINPYNDFLGIKIGLNSFEDNYFQK